MHDWLAADLTALTPAWKDSEGRQGEFFPSFCLPWFPGEPPLVGMAAATHRRASEGDSVHLEVRFDPHNPGRRSWTEGWLAATHLTDSLEPLDKTFAWTPPGENRVRSVRFEQVVRQALRDAAASQQPRTEGAGAPSVLDVMRETTLGLVVPAGLGPGPRETLLSELRADWKDIWFFPRTVAAALTWCTSGNARTVAAQYAADVGGTVGAILVITGASDTWEVAKVPLRLDNSAGGPLLSPVHDRTKLRSETDHVGLAETLDFDPAEETWETLLGALLESQTIAPTTNTLANKASLLAQLATDAASRQHGSLSSLPPSMEKSLAEDNDHRVFGILCAGPWTELSQLPHDLQKIVNTFDRSLSFPGSEAFLTGTETGLGRLHEGLPPYYEALAPLQLYFLGQNAWLDPQVRWLDLLQENTEVPAGRLYETPEPIRGLFIPAGKDPVVELTLRVQKRGETEYRGIDELIQADLLQAMPVAVSARVAPGQGLARVLVRSEDGRTLDAAIREDRAVQREGEPQTTFGWPPGSAWLVSHEYLASPAMPELSSLVAALKAKKNVVAHLRTARLAVNKWLIPSAAVPPVKPETLTLPPEVHPLFAYLSVFPGISEPAQKDVEPLLQDLERLLPQAFQRAPTQEQAAILWFSSWLYARCPEELLQHARKALLGSAPKAQVLAVTGNCFHKPEDYELAFTQIARAVKRDNVAPKDWLRTWRNLARFRHDALAMDCLSNKTQHDLMESFLTVFETATPSASGSNSFLHCCYLAPHVLKRRRFDPRFLEPDSKLGLRFAKVLSWAAKAAKSPKHRANVECAREFLLRQADATTLVRLVKAE